MKKTGYFYGVCVCVCVCERERERERECVCVCVYVCGFFYFFTLFFTIILQMGFLPWEIRVAFPRESQLPQSRATQPTVPAGCFSVSIFPANSDMDHGIFHVRTNVNAFDCTRECTDTVIVS